MFLWLAVSAVFSAGEFVDANGIEYSDEAHTKIIGVTSKFAGNLVIEDSVTEIGEKAFFGVTVDVTVNVLIQNVKVIGESAFEGIKVTGHEISIAAETMTIGKRAFYGCYADEGNFRGNGVIGVEAFAHAHITTFNIDAGGDLLIEEFAFNNAFCTHFYITGSGFNAIAPRGSLSALNDIKVFEVRGKDHQFAVFAFKWWGSVGSDVVIDVENLNCPGSLMSGCAVNSLTVKGKNHSYAGKLIDGTRGNCPCTSLTIAVDGIALLDGPYYGVNVTKLVLDKPAFSALGEDSFKNMNYEGEWTFHQSFVDIKAGIFAGSNVQGTVSIPSGLATVGADAFKGCINITDFSMSQGQSFLGDNGAILNAGMTDIVLFPLGKTGDYAIKQSIATINSAIMTPNSITTFTVEGGETFKAESGVVYDFAGKSLVVAPGKLAGTVTIPATVTDIAASALEGCQAKFAAVTLKGASIGSRAFFGCTNLETVTLTDCHVGVLAFTESGVKTLTVTTAEDMKTYTFANMTSLTTVTVKVSSAWIEAEAFTGCTAIASLTVEATHAKFLTGAFGHSEIQKLDLTKSKDIEVHGPLVEQPGHIATVAMNGCEFGCVFAGAFAGVQCEGQISFNVNCTTIGEMAFADTHGITGEIVLAGALTEIQSTSFRDCRLITAFKITSESGRYSTVDGLIIDLFYLKVHCRYITVVPLGMKAQVTIAKDYGKQVDTIGELFAASSVTGFVIDAENPHYSGGGDFLLDKAGNNLLVWANGQTDVVMPANVTAIGSFAFAFRTINTINFNEVRTINPMGMLGCTLGCETLVLPSTLTSVTDGALEALMGPKTLKIEAENGWIANAFRHASFETLIVSGNKVNLFTNVFVSLAELKTVIISGTEVGMRFNELGSIGTKDKPVEVIINGTTCSLGETADCYISKLTIGGVNNTYHVKNFERSSVDELVFCGHNISMAGVVNGLTVHKVVLDLPDFVQVCKDAFKNASYTGTVAFSVGSTTIGEDAFHLSAGEGVTGDVIFPTTLTDVAAGAFMGCTGIELVWFKASQVTLGYESFSGCTGVTGVYFRAKELDVHGVADAFDAKHATVSYGTDPAPYTDSESPSIDPTSTDSGSGGSKTTAILIASISVGVIVIVVAVVVVFITWRRRRSGFQSLNANLKDYTSTPIE